MWLIMFQYKFLRMTEIIEQSLSNHLDFDSVGTNFFLATLVFSSDEIIQIKSENPVYNAKLQIVLVLFFHHGSSEPAQTYDRL